MTRHRERSRARLAVTANISDDVTGTVGIASGALDDVQSANQTQTGFFSRKTIGFDRFFATWKPSSVKGLSVVAGKFPYTWERTSLTLGNDINPEGVSSSYTLAATGTLESITLTAFALPLFEVSNGADSYIGGGQLQSKWKLAPKVAARLSYASLSFHGVDAIAQAFTAGTIKPSSTNTNSVRTDSAGKVIGYKTGFSYSDIIAAVEFTSKPHWPVTVLVDGARNQKAAAGQRTALYTDVRAGRLSQRNDVQFSWSYYRIERDAVVGALNEQDLRAATNVINHRAGISYQWRSNTVLNLGVWYGKLLEPTLSGKLAAPGMKTACTMSPFAGCRDPWLSRVQLDASYRF